MSRILTGVFEIMPVADGSQTFPTMEVTGAASQSYSGDTFFPDWKGNAALRPVFRPRCFDGTSGSSVEFGFVAGIATDAGAASSASQQWYYNNVGIVWSSAGGGKYRSANFLSADGTTPLMELDVSDTAHPRVTFIGNIPQTLSQGDDDVVRFIGKVDGLDDFRIDVSHTIRISELAGGTGNKLDLILSKSSFDNDDSTDDAIEVNVGAVIGNAYVAGFAAIAGAGYKVSFADSVGIDSPYFKAGASAVPASASMLTLHPDDIGGTGVIVGKLLNQGGSVVASVSEVLKDLGDPDIISFDCHTVASESSTVAVEPRQGSVKRGEFLRCVAKVTNRTGESDRTGSYTLKNPRVLKGDGSVVADETVKVKDWTKDGNTYKVYVVSFDTCRQHGGLRIVCEAERRQ